MNKPIEIFCCYAHADRSHLLELKKHLASLVRQRVINDIWYDAEISPGTDWEREITKHLNVAQLVLLLVSPDFMASDYCYNKEMLRAIERHERGEAWVIPVILRQVYGWHEAPFGKLQALPTGAQPVTGWQNLDEAFSDVAKGIYKAIEKLLPKQPQPVSAVQCTKRSFKPVKNGCEYEIEIKSPTKEHNLRIVVDYGWKNILYLDGREIFQEQRGLIASLSIALEVYRKPVPIISHKFRVDDYFLDYIYSCRKVFSRGTYTITIKLEDAVIFKDEGLYYN